MHKPTTTPSQSVSVLSVQQTLWSLNTGSFANTSEWWRNIDSILKDELDENLNIDYPDFFNMFLDGISKLDEKTSAVFAMCKKSSH
jgi:hypothetical protein